MKNKLFCKKLSFGYDVCSALDYLHKNRCVKVGSAANHLCDEAKRSCILTFFFVSFFVENDFDLSTVCFVFSVFSFLFVAMIMKNRVQRFGKD